MKTALIIDGNYLMSKDVFALYGLKTLHKDLLDLLKIDIDRLSSLYNFDKKYFVSDSKVGYWRKKTFSDYKSTRKPDDRIDWKWVYSEYDKFKEYVNENSDFQQIEVDKAEGDDVIAYIVNNNNESGFSNIIVASDSDLRQLSRFSLHRQYINIFLNYKYSDERVYLPDNYEVFLDDIRRTAQSTLFDMNDTDEFLIFVEGLTSNTKVVKVNPEELLFVKIVSGDKKDAVPSSYTWETKTKKTYGIGPQGGKRIYDLYRESYGDEPIDFDSDAFIEQAARMVSYYKKIEDAAEIESIMNNLKRNRELLILSEKYLPKYVREKLQESVSF